MSGKAPIYLDYQATTPLDERVLEAMMPFLSGTYGNPHSSTHRYGWQAAAGVDKARTDIARAINARDEEIIFTSGATEANNLAIKGAAQAIGGTRGHMVSVVTEHKCVLEAMEAVRQMGMAVTLLPVGSDGLVDLDQLADAVTGDTALVSVMAVNNEIGVIQPLAPIGRICREAGALFHCDGAQALGKIPLDVEAQGIDLLSLSAHKVYGPKGVGALFVRAGTPLVPQMSGGGQERGIRSGTLSPALCAGFGAAVRLSLDDMGQEEIRLAALRDRFLNQLRQAHPAVRLNGSSTDRWPGNLNLSFPGMDGDLLLANLRGLAVSSGAACASAVEGPSYVLGALGLSPAMAKSSLRIGFGRYTTEEEVDQAVFQLDAALTKMGGLKP